MGASCSLLFFFLKHISQANFSGDLAIVTN